MLGTTQLHTGFLFQGDIPTTNWSVGMYEALQVFIVIGGGISMQTLTRVNGRGVLHRGAPAHDGCQHRFINVCVFGVRYTPRIHV
jgi:hypothetical protein